MERSTAIIWAGVPSPGAEPHDNKKLSASTRVAKTLKRQLRGLSGVFRVGNVEMEAGICDRTQAVQGAILGALPDVSACGDVTAGLLAGIAGFLEISDMGVPALKFGDFAGLSGLMTLVNTDNQVAPLPSDIFSGPTGVPGWS